MYFPEIKDCRNYLWTSHSKRKLFQYGLGPGLIKRVIRHPDRKEEGIAKNTVAVMKDKSTKAIKKEVWVMYQIVKGKKRIISAWIYPGKTEPGAEIYVPDEVWEEITRNKNLEVENS
jgi:hypothetical protein